MLLVAETLAKYGYDPTKLKKRSNKKVCVSCDYCGIRFVQVYDDYTSGLSKLHNVACGSCKHTKRVEINRMNYDYHVGERHHRLYIECFSHRNPYNQPQMFCRCECGGYNVSALSNILQGRIRSCGCLKEEAAVKNGRLRARPVIYGQKINGILPIRPYEDRDKKYSLASICRCHCGNEFVAANRELLNGRRRGCGDCGLMRNGASTSQVALDIDDIIQTQYLTTHNYKAATISVAGRRINIDIAIPRHKVAIEYNGFYYHQEIRGDRSEYDLQRATLLIDDGWSVLSIDGYKDIPDASVILQYIDTLAHTSENHLTIVMDDWVRAKVRLDAKIKAVE